MSKGSFDILWTTVEKVTVTEITPFKLISTTIKCAETNRRSPDRSKEMMCTQNMIQLSTQYAGFPKNRFLIHPLCCQNEAKNTYRRWGQVIDCFDAISQFFTLL